MKQRTHTVSIADTQRLDQYLSNEWTDLSRSQIKKAIKAGNLTVNHEKVKPSVQIQVGDVITLVFDETAKENAPLIATHQPLDIRYEDEYLLVVNKRQGQVVHPSEEHDNETLVNDLLGYAETNHFSLPVGAETFRPGIVHRLDKDTGGLMVIAKSDKAYHELIQQFKYHEVQRTYLGLVYGTFTETNGTIDAPIGRDPKQRLRFKAIPSGKTAVTHFEVLKQYQEGLSLLAFQLETGRTHQIRVHTRYINHPICDDPLYATKYQPRFFSNKGQLLYAYRLAFEHPITGEPLVIESELPSTFQSVVDQLHPEWESKA